MIVPAAGEDLRPHPRHIRNLMPVIHHGLLGPEVDLAARLFGAGVDDGYVRHVGIRRNQSGRPQGTS